MISILILLFDFQLNLPIINKLGKLNAMSQGINTDILDGASPNIFGIRPLKRNKIITGKGITRAIPHTHDFNLFAINQQQLPAAVLRRIRHRIEVGLSLGLLPRRRGQQARLLPLAQRHHSGSQPS